MPKPQKSYTHENLNTAQYSHNTLQLTSWYLRRAAVKHGLSPLMSSS